MAKMRVAVIGSGFGGLSTAIRLQTAGFQVKLFEKRDQLGGCAYVYRDKGFTFDAGPTIITDPECLAELFENADRKMSDYVELVPVSPFYRLLWDDGSTFNYSNDLDVTLEQIRELSPDDEQGYLDLLKYSEMVFNEAYTKLAPVPFLNWWSMVRASPQLLRLKTFHSVFKTVASFIKNDRLRQAFSFHSLLMGGNPFTASSVYTLGHHLQSKWGVFFPKGGTGELVRGLAKLFTDLGGEIALNSAIDCIRTRDGRVTGVAIKPAGVWPCDAVVSNADVVHTYRDLLGGEPLASKTARRLEKMDHSMSLFLIYFGTKKRYPQLAHHNVLFGQRYKGLLDDIFKNGVLPDDFSLYLNAPSTTDPSLAPPGGEAFYVLSPVANLGNLDIDWKDEGPRYADRILNYLESHYLPDLRENIVTQKIFTPEDFKKELNFYQGAAFSLEPTLTQTGFFRAHNRDDKLRGMYVVGAATHPGAGIPGVVNSAKATATLMIEDYATRLDRRTPHEKSQIPKTTSPAPRPHRPDRDPDAQL